ncbi:hypothetical protein GYB59_00500 [bacterium]|nr:hypothetical protein [bacterium]
MTTATASLTKRQSSILAFVTQYIQAHGYSPSQREIADSQGFSSLTAVRGHLEALERKGQIRRSSHTSRSIQLVSHRLRVALPYSGEVS